MANCINKSHPDFINLLNETGFSKMKLSGKIKSWRRETGREEDFPKLEDIKPDIIPDNKHENSSMRFNTSLNKEGSAQYAYEVNEGITHYFFEYFFNSGKGLSQFINGDLQKLIPEAYKYAKEQLENLNNPDLRFALDRWNEAKELHNEFLSNFKLQSEDYRDQSDENEEIDSGGLRTDWFNKDGQFSNIKSASNITRLLIATMPNIDYTDEGFSQVRNSLGLPKLVDFGKTFNLFANKLANNYTIKDIGKALDEMAKDGINEAITLSKRVYINDRLDSVDKYHTLLPFVQAMAKYKNNYIISQMMPDGSVKEINATNESLEHSITKEWKNNEEKSRSNNREFFVIDNEEDNKITYDITKFREVFGKLDNKGKYVNNINTIDNAKYFLSILGIEFSGQDNETPEIQNTIISRASKIADNIIRHENNNRLFQNMEDHNSKEDLETIIKAQKKLTPYEYIENMIFIKGGKKIYANSLFSYFTRTIVKINKTTSENFDKLFPHLTNDSYSRNSKLVKLMKEGKLQIEESVLVENKTENKQDEYNKLSEGDRFRLVFEKYRNNEYALLRPESNKQEHFIKLPPIVNPNNKEELNELLLGYIEDELSVISIGYEIDGVSENGILLSKLNNDTRLQIIKDFKEGNMSFKDNKDIRDIILAELEGYIEERVINLANRFVNYGLVEFKDGKLKDNILGIQNEVTADNFKASVRNMFINNMIAGIEQTKIFSGNPIFYKSPDKFFKRLGQMVGTKDTSFSDQQINDFINLVSDTGKRLAENESRDLEIDVNVVYDSRGNVTDERGVSVINIAVKEDVNAYSDQFNNEKLDKEEKKYYQEMTEDDGIGFITLDGARRLLTRNGEWKYTMREHEGKYQWEIQKALGIPESDMVYINPTTGESQPMKVNKDFIFNSLKLQGFGALSGSSFVPSNEKASFIILSPSITEGRNMDEVRMEMTYKGVDILLTESGKKVGAPKTKHKSYTDDGNVNGRINEAQQIPVENISVQLKTGNKFKKKVTTGTQMMMHIIGDIVDMGNSREGFEGGEELVSRFITLNNKRIELGAEILKEQFGIIRENDGYRVTNGERLRSLIKDEINRRELPYNALDGLNRIIEENSFNIDTIVNRKDIEHILNSLADKEVFRQKRNGRAPYQIPSTFFESDAREFVVFKKDKNGKAGELVAKGIKDISEYDKDKYIFKVTSNFLKFYKNKDGKVTKMQVGIPSYIDGIGDTTKIDDKRLLQLIGFRIPTQGLASIEAIEPVFLPKNFGDTILLPTEIVAKSGSDFDIDKMNIYIPNFYYGKDGKPVYLDKFSKYSEYLDAERSRVVSNVLNKISKEIEVTPFVRKTIDEVVGELSIGKGAFFEDILLKLKDRRDQIKGKNIESFNKLGAVLQQLVADKTDLNEYGISENQFKKLIVENELTELMSDIATHPSNWLNLITPISSHDLVNLANENPEGSIMETFFDIVDFGKQIDQHQQFIEGDEAIGRTALGSKFHIFAQQNRFFFKPTYEDPSGEQRDSILNLPYNKTEEGNISLGNLTNQADESIGKILKEFVNTAVDNPTELALKKLNAGLDTINTWMFLVMSGVPIRTIKDFMNQPIILKYLENKKKNESHIVNVAGVSRNKKQIAGDTIKAQYPAKVSKKNGKILIKDTKNKLSAKDLYSEDNKGVKSTKKYADQYQILVDYLRYEEMASHIVSAQQALSYDNNSIGKNPAETLLKIINTKDQIDNSAIGNLGRALGINKKLVKKKVKVFKNKKVELLDSNYPYTKDTPVNNRGTDFIFTENAEAYTASQNLVSENDETNFPYFPNKPKLNVTATNNQAGIRTDKSGKVNPNAFGIVVKKYQHSKDGKFIAQEGTFKDIEEDFNMFKSLNNHVFDRLRNSVNSKVTVPKQFALGKAALPKRFAEWLQDKLDSELGVLTEIKENENKKYSGFGLTVIGILEKSAENQIKEIETTEEEIEKSYTGYEAVYYDQAQESLEVLKSFSPKILKVNIVFKEIERFAKKIHKKKGLSNDDKVRIIDKFRDDLITKIMLTQWSNISGIEQEPIINQLDRLTTNSKDNLSVGEKIKQIQDIIKRGNEDIDKLKQEELGFYEKFKNDPFINTVIVPINKYVGDNLKYPNINTTRLEGNNIIEAIEQGVKKGVSDFYTDIYKLSILQTGNQNSPLSIRKFLPDKYYGELMQNMLDGLSEEDLHNIISPMQIGNIQKAEEDDTYNSSLFEWEFEIMNYNDDKIISRKDMDAEVGDLIQTPRLLLKYQEDYQDKNGNINREKLQEEVRSKRINPYSAVPRIQIMTSDGKKNVTLGSLGTLPMPIKDLRNEASLNIYGRPELDVITREILRILNEDTEVKAKQYCKR